MCPSAMSTHMGLYLWYYGHLISDTKGHGANMGPIWGRQAPGGPHDGPMNIAIWVGICGICELQIFLNMIRIFDAQFYQRN